MASRTADLEHRLNESRRERRDKRKAVTIHDVAREAQVSYATVSRVVNNKNSIVPEKRARVQAAMERLGYVPNLQARKLAGGSSQVVGLVLHDVWSSYVVEILRGIDEEVAAAEYDLMLYTSRRRAASESAHVTALTQGLAEGLLLLLPHGLKNYVERLQQRHFPFVVIDYDASHGNVPAVGATNRQGARDAMRYLLDLGHRRIGFITGDMEVDSARARLAGYREALQLYGADVDPGLIIEGDFLQPRAVAAARQLLRLRNPPTAIFASNDVSAFGVLDAAHELGLRVPEELSVVGFDDIPQAAYVRPMLTTVHQPLEDMGRVAARMLLAAMRSPHTVAPGVELPTQLVVRNSTTVPRPLKA